MWVGFGATSYLQMLGGMTNVLAIAAKTHRTVLSTDHFVIILLSELMATHKTGKVWPVRVDLHAPDTRSQVQR